MRRARYTGRESLTRQSPAVTLPRSKRVFDVVVASLLLLVTAPLWLVIALVIRVTSPGPVLFRQERIGQGGRPFVVLKFRTMRHGASEEPHRAFVIALMAAVSTEGAATDGIYKLAMDSRITWIGRWLRATSLDELPQLINVLRGEMSLIGPRPAIGYEVEAYEDWQRERLAARPGITGLWQVSGRNRLSYRRMCELDIEYIRSWSLWRDLQIAAQTPWVMIVRRGGAR